MNRSASPGLHVAWFAGALLVAGRVFAQQAEDGQTEAAQAEHPSAAQERQAEEPAPLPEELELTMKLMPEGAERPEAIIRLIELPAAAGERGAQASAPGRARADAAREQREQGLDRAAEAREKGRELGEELSERASENREDAGRGRPPERPPDHSPDVPRGPPDGN